MPIERFVVRTEPPDHAPDDASTASDVAAIGAALGAGLTSLTSEQSVGHDNATAPRRRYASLLEPTGQMQLLAEATDGRILDVNPSAAAFYGWPRETMQSLLLQDLDATTVHEWRTLARAIASGTSRRIAIAHRVASGAVCTVDAYGRQLTVDGRHVLHIFVRDASERVRADRLMLESAAGLRLIRKLQAVCTRAANTAHEFNSLLTVISGSAAFLRQDMVMQGRALDDLDAITRASTRAEELTRELLTAVRNELPRLRTVDLADQLQQASARIRERVGPGIHVVLRPAESPVLAQMESAELPDAFWTLMDHAPTAMPFGGELTLRAALIARDDGEGTRHYAALEVCDSNAAIDDTTRRHLVDALQTSSPFQPSALSALTSAGESFVSAEATVGVGTTFRLHFPAAQSMSASMLAPAMASRVVLLCSDPLLRDNTRRMLKKLDRDVVVAESPDEAIDAVRGDGDAHWDVVTDLASHEPAGVKLVDMLRTLRSAVVVLAGSDADSTLRRDVDARPVQRLSKPFTMAELEQALRAARAGLQ